MEATLDHAFIVININCVCSILLPNGTHSLSSTTWKSQYVWMFLLKKMNYCRCNVPITTKLQLAPRPHFRWENENTVDAPESPQQSIEFQTCQSVFISTLWGLLLCTLNISAAMTQKKRFRPCMSLVWLVIFYANYTSLSMAERRRVTLPRPWFDANLAWRGRVPCNLLNWIQDTLPAICL